MNKAVIDNLNYYLGLEKPEYAFMVSGSWGVGKTHFVKEYFKKKVPEVKKLVWVSLFGLKKTTEIDQEIFQSLHPILSSKAVKISGNILKGALSLGLKVDIDGDGKSNESINAKINGNGILDIILGSNSNDLTFVFDDLERTNIEKSEIFGYINKLIEDSDVKVIIIANEEKLFDNNDEDKVYIEFKEKVIGKTFEVGHDFDNVLESYLSDKRHQVLVSYKEEIKQVYLLSNYKNLRNVKQSISDFIYVYENLDEKFLDNNEFISSLVKSFFSLSFEVKKGVLKEVQLLSNSIFKRDDLIYKKYFSYYTCLYNGELWSDILFKGNLTLLNDNTSKLTMFYTPQDTPQDKPTWLKLLNYRDLENKEFNSLIETLNNEVKCSYECKPREFLHKISMLIYFNKLNLIRIDLKNVKSWVKDYICKYRKKDLWDDGEIDLSSPHSGTGYSYLSFDNKDFIRIGRAIEKVNNNIYLCSENSKKDKAKKKLLKELLSVDIGIIKNILYVTYRSTPIFHELSAAEFVNNLKLMKNAYINNLGSILRYRYLTHDSLNGVEYGDYLKSEICFWKNTKSILDENPSDGLKSLVISEFSETIISSVISRLSKDS